MKKRCSIMIALLCVLSFVAAMCPVISAEDTGAEIVWFYVILKPGSEPAGDAWGPEDLPGVDAGEVEELPLFDEPMLARMLNLPEEPMMNLRFTVPCVGGAMGDEAPEVKKRLEELECVADASWSLNKGEHYPFHGPNHPSSPSRDPEHQLPGVFYVFVKNGSEPAGDTWGPEDFPGVEVTDVEVRTESLLILKVPYIWLDESTEPAERIEELDFVDHVYIGGIEYPDDLVVTVGDVDGDWDVTSTDARLVLQLAVGKIRAEDINAAAGDIDGDDEITSTDARILLQMAVRPVELPT